MLELQIGSKLDKKRLRQAAARGQLPASLRAIPALLINCERLC
jgi:hypothetical protein